MAFSQCPIVSLILTNSFLSTYQSRQPLFIGLSLSKSVNLLLLTDSPFTCCTSHSCLWLYLVSQLHRPLQAQVTIIILLISLPSAQSEGKAEVSTKLIATCLFSAFSSPSMTSHPLYLNESVSFTHVYFPEVSRGSRNVLEFSVPVQFEFG